MLQIILFRHAKSSWAIPGMDDFDRPLNERGHKAAITMGNWLHNQGITPDKVLCSSATRTRETSADLAKHLDLTGKVEFLNTLYLATAENIKAEIERLSDTVKTAMVIGHNPGIHDLALRLLREDQRRSSGALRVTYPTATCTIISLTAENWQNLEWGNGTLITYMRPKALRSSKQV